MQALDLVRELYGHMEWADATLWRTVLASEAAGGDQRLRELLHHLHLVQRGFLSLWTCTPFDPKEGEGLAPREVAVLARKGHETIGTYIASIEPGVLDEPFVLPWSEPAAQRLGRPTAAPSSLGQTLLQVAMHTQHHRAQASQRLRQLGVEPPMTDFIAWVWLAKPAAEWSV